MLSPSERKSLKARAHPLEPVVTIGGKGVTGAVLAEIERALQAHELIKIRAAALEREERERALEAICEKTGAQAVQHIGKVLVVFRKNDEP
jgi:RNA-binding protein